MVGVTSSAESVQVRTSYICMAFRMSGQWSLQKQLLGVYCISLVDVEE